MNERVRALQERAAGLEAEARQQLAAGGDIHLGAGRDDDGVVNAGSDGGDGGDDAFRALRDGARNAKPDPEDLEPIAPRKQQAQPDPEVARQLRLAQAEIAKRDRELTRLLSTADENRVLNARLAELEETLGSFKREKDLNSYDPLKGIPQELLENLDPSVVEVIKMVARNNRQAMPDVESIVDSRVKKANDSVMQAVDNKLTDSTFQVMVRSERHGVPNLDELLADESPFMDYIQSSGVRSSAFKSAVKQRNIAAISTIKELVADFEASGKAAPRKSKESPNARASNGRQQPSRMESDDVEFNQGELDRIKLDARSPDPKVREAAHARFAEISRQAAGIASRLGPQ